MSFQEFTRTRLFQPLGMTHTSWRDDYTRIVKGRAQAYRERDGAFHTDMPFENVYGNGGLLTTVGDLLKWNQHYDAPAGGRRRDDRRAADAGPLQRRPPARLRPRPVHRHLQGTARGLSQRIDRRLQRLSHAVSRAARLGCGAVQRGERAGDAVRARGRGSLSRRSAEAVRGRRRRTRSLRPRRIASSASGSATDRRADHDRDETTTACGSGARHRCSRSRRWP